MVGPFGPPEGLHALISETAELTLAGVMVMGPMGGGFGLPHFPWSPSEVADLTEDARASYLELLRGMREKIKPQ